MADKLIIDCSLHDVLTADTTADVQAALDALPDDASDDERAATAERVVTEKTAELQDEMDRLEAERVKTVELDPADEALRLSDAKEAAERSAAAELADADRAALVAKLRAGKATEAEVQTVLAALLG